MAANSSSLRFTVEVAADQADQALKAMTLAFNQAGAQARIAMPGIGGASKGAGAEVVSLGDKIKGIAREQRSEARDRNWKLGSSWSSRCRELDRSRGFGSSHCDILSRGIGNRSWPRTTSTKRILRSSAASRGSPDISRAWSR